MGLKDRFKKVFASDKRDNDDFKSLDGESDGKNSSNVVDGSPDRNFRYLDDLIHSGEKKIILDSDIVLEEGEESSYHDGIKLDVDGIVIDGNGKTIDAKHETRIFCCTAGNVTIKNVKFQYGNSNGNGGAIDNSGDLTIIKSIFYINRADYGGAIDNSGNLTIVESEINDNRANKGGAIINTGDLIISGSVLSDNSAKNDYGAIINKGGKLSIVDSSIINNKSSFTAGGIFNYMEGELNVEESSFISNVSDYSEGGAIVNLASMSIRNSLFEGNSSKDGGAIWSSNLRDVTVDSCDFTDNTSKHGGAIYYYEHDLLGSDGALFVDVDESRSEKLIIINSNFQGNDSSEGGAIASYSRLDLKDSNFINNVASHGGSIYNYDYGKLAIDHCNFKSNRNKDTHYNGGGVICTEGDVNILHSNFEDNRSSNYGVMKCSGGKITISDSCFKENLSENRALISFDEELTLKRCIFKGNVSSNGMILDNDGFCRIHDCRFFNNVAGENIILNSDFLEMSNAFFNDNRCRNLILNKGSNFGVFNGKFVDNAVESSVIHNVKDGSISESTFKGNLSQDDSRNVYNSDELTISNLKIEYKGKSIENEGHIIIKGKSGDVESKIWGGGTFEVFGSRNIVDNFDFAYLDKVIHESSGSEIVLKENVRFEDYEREFYEGGIELDIDNLVIDGNGKTIDGAGMSRIFIITGDNITLKNITFINGFCSKNYNNSLNDHGGALRISSAKNLRIMDCTFKDNSSKVCGGAIYGGKYSSYSVCHCNFSSNSALYGGAIINGGDLNIAESSFISNEASDDGGMGGAICNYENGELGVEKCSFVGNISDEGGNAVDNSGKLDILKSKFSNNHSTYPLGEGAVQNNGCGVLSIIDSTFSENGESVFNWARGEISDSIFLNNSTNSRATVYNGFMAKLTIDNSKFAENTSREDGGAIENFGLLNIADSIFDNNESEKGAAAIFNGEYCEFDRYSPEEIAQGKNRYFGRLSISRCIFSNNTSKATGGAIKNFGMLDIADSDFSHNGAGDKGGAIENFAELRVVQSKFRSNKSDVNGGAICTGKNAEFRPCISDSIFSEGRICLNEINDCIFEENEPNDIYEDLEGVDFSEVLS